MARIIKLQPQTRTGKRPRSPHMGSKLIRVAACSGKLVITSKE